jgi:hypothetical protein
VNTGQNSGPGFCRLNGSHVPFDAVTLAALYPTHEAYVAAVKEATAPLVEAGYLLALDAQAIVAEAETSSIGKR